MARLLVVAELIPAAEEGRKREKAEENAYIIRRRGRRSDSDGWRRYLKERLMRREAASWW